MAQRTVIRLVDDLDDTEIVDGTGEKVSFALDDRQYEIDLTNDHADEMRAALDRYVRAARKVAGRPSRARAQATVGKAAAPVDYSTRAVRAWARANKIDVSPRGRIPHSGSRIGWWVPRSADEIGDLARSAARNRARSPISLPRRHEPPTDRHTAVRGWSTGSVPRATDPQRG